MKSLKIGSYSTYLAKVSKFYDKKEVKIYTNLILTLVTISFFALFAIKPTISTIASLAKEIKDQEEVAEKLDQKIKSLQLAKKEYNANKSKLYLINEALPLNPETALFLGQIEILAQENHLELSSVQTEGLAIKGESIKNEKKIVSKKANPSFNTQLILTGEYPQIESFLKAINNLRRIVSIENISINKSKKDSTATLSFKLETEAFHLSLNDPK